MTRPLVDVVGCGRAARVLLRWLQESGQIDIGQVCNRSLASAEAAVRFMGSGQAVTALEPGGGDWLLLGLPDGMIEQQAERLAAVLKRPPRLVFHLSGAVSSRALAALAPAAAVHPVRAFADPELALQAMSGTWCLAEGEAAVLAELQPRFEAAGARWTLLGTGSKALYHAATVVASNYQVTLTELARSLADAAGLEAGTAAAIVEDLQRDSLTRLAQAPAAAVLTGPIERADAAALERQLKALDAGAGQAEAALFRALGLATLALARSGRGERPGDARIEALLTNRAD